MTDYPKFPSIERFENLYCVISEKIDGTNGLIEIHKDGTVKFGSRKKYLSKENDNYGFYSFFNQQIDNLKNISSLFEEDEYPIRIYGEWFGQGIQRNYGLKEKYFMPFSTHYAELLINYSINNVVQPHIFYTGKFNFEFVNRYMNELKISGSCFNNFNNPEGIVVHFPNYNFRLKETFEGPKWKLKNGNN